jgi:hypothetical protein
MVDYWGGQASLQAARKPQQAGLKYGMTDYAIPTHKNDKLWLIQ